ncbi:hypothetical protein JEQ12_017600 [Ovis aries]|uniref:Uncharacterized protein n=1 Tax=Ovis aries TaxID=9940 RepID=A0A836A7B9_SHEEP|nr:hypothetical protein JEQ12_017600 [Ovis aries]
MWCGAALATPAAAAAAAAAARLGPEHRAGGYSRTSEHALVDTSLFGNWQGCFVCQGSWDDVLDEPSKEVRLVQLNEADVLRILAETLAARIEAVFPDQTVPV